MIDAFFKLSLTRSIAAKKVIRRSDRLLALNTLKKHKNRDACETDCKNECTFSSVASPGLSYIVTLVLQPSTSAEYVYGRTVYVTYGD